MGGARWLLSSGLLGSDDTRRTVRDWVVDLAIFAVAVAAGVYVLRSTWEQHSDRGRGARHRARERRLRRAVVAA